MQKFSSRPWFYENCCFSHFVLLLWAGFCILFTIWAKFFETLGFVVAHKPIYSVYFATDITVLAYIQNINRAMQKKKKKNYAAHACLFEVHQLLKYVVTVTLECVQCACK